MGISSLPIQSIKRLNEVVTDIEDVLVRRDALMDEADALKEKRDKAIELQSKLDSKALEFNKLSTSIDAKELKDIIDKLEETTIEIEKINNDYKEVHKKIVELSNIKDELTGEYEEIIKNSNIENSENKEGIFVETLNTNIYIVDASIPVEKEKISPITCEIINCSENFVNEVSNSFRKNINQIITETEEFDFDKFNDEINEYKKEKNSSLDKMLEFVNKTEEMKEETENIINEKPIVEEETIQEEVNNEPEQSIIEEPVVQEPIVEEKEELETPVDEMIVNHDTETSNSALDRQVEEIANKENSRISIDELINNDSVSELYIDKNNVLHKMTRATKDKFYNKITKILEGTCPKTIIKPLQNLDATNSSGVVDIDNFLNNRTA